MRPRLLSILTVAAAPVLLTLSADVRSQTGQVPLPTVREGTSSW